MEGKTTKVEGNEKGNNMIGRKRSEKKEKNKWIESWEWIKNGGKEVTEKQRKMWERKRCVTLSLLTITTVVSIVVTGYPIIKKSVKKENT